jgi:hypothetical protein
MDILTNVGIYAAIAEESYTRMQESLANNRRPKQGGEGGFVLTWDPTASSFKDAMIAVVFAYMFIEAACFVANLRRGGRAKAKSEDGENPEIRVKNLGGDSALVDRVRTYREMRRKLVHEKAAELSAIGSLQRIRAQDLAEEAIAVMRDVSALLMPYLKLPMTTT